MEEELGKRLKTKELADFLEVNEKTVRQHYKKLGGIRLGSRYIFFERKVIDAISEKWEMESPSKNEWKEEGTDIQVKKRSNSMGKQNEAGRKRVGRKDRHNLLD